MTDEIRLDLSIPYISPPPGTSEEFVLVNRRYLLRNEALCEKLLALYSAVIEYMEAGKDDASDAYWRMHIAAMSVQTSQQKSPADEAVEVFRERYREAVAKPSLTPPGWRSGQSPGRDEPMQDDPHGIFDPRKGHD